MSTTRNVSIQVVTHPDPNHYTFVLLIDGRLPLPEDGIIETIWDLGDGTVITGLDLEVEHTYATSGSYTVSVEVVFEGDGKGDGDKNAPPTGDDPPSFSLSSSIDLGF